MKKKKIFLLSLFVIAFVTQYSCELQKDPISDFSELTTSKNPEDDKEEIKTKEEIVALRNGLYSTIRILHVIGTPI